MYIYIYIHIGKFGVFSGLGCEGGFGEFREHQPFWGLNHSTPYQYNTKSPQCGQLTSTPDAPPWFISSLLGLETEVARGPFRTMQRSDV